MAYETKVNDENIPAGKKQVFSSESGTYWRVNPDDDCEIQSASDLTANGKPSIDLQLPS